MDFRLPELPYSADGLEPHISRQTVNIHHNQHQATYVNRTNSLLCESGRSESDMIEVIRFAHEEEKVALLNNAVQAFNHMFYWNSMRPNAGGLPTGTIAALIDADFTSFDEFVEEIHRTASGVFGSGWIWVVLDHGHLRITQNANADTPLVHGQLPILAIDLWEHAYYLDYHHRKDDYLTAVIRYLLNWDFANHNLRSSFHAPPSLPAVHAMFNHVFSGLA